MKENDHTDQDQDHDHTDQDHDRNLIHVTGMIIMPKDQEFQKYS